MQLGNNSSNGGVQKVFINSLLSFKKPVAFQHTDNNGLKDILNLHKIEVINSEFEIPTLKNDFGGSTYYRIIYSLAKIFFDNIRLKKKLSRKFDILI